MNATPLAAIPGETTDGTQTIRHEKSNLTYDPRNRTFRRVTPCRDSLAARHTPADPFVLPETITAMATAFATAYHRAALQLIDATTQTYLAGFVPTEVSDTELRDVRPYLDFLEDYDVAGVEDAQRRAFSKIDW